MRHAWTIYALYYASTTLISTYTLVAICGGAKTFGLAVSAFCGLQALRALPDRGLLSLPGTLVRWLNYHVVLTFYRSNYIYTLAFAIAASLAPFVGLAYIAFRLFAIHPATILLNSVAVVAFVNYTRGLKIKSHVKDFPRTGGKKRVAVIGGGCAGIVASKEMLDEGHEVVGFESASMLGGVWNSGDHTSKRTTGNTLSSSSRSNSFFGDYPMPSSVANGPNGEQNVHPTHYTEADFRNYLLSYASSFGVDKLYRLRTSVTSARKVASSASGSAGGYVITSAGPDGKQCVDTFDFMVIASGLNQTCSGLQLGAEGGQASHTCSIRGNRAYQGKKVVVVGLGESSSDASSDIANVASEVHVVVRSPVLLLPRNTFGTKIAPDHKLSRLVLLCPQFVRTWKLMSQTAIHGPMNVIASRLLGLGGCFGVDLRALDSSQAKFSAGRPCDIGRSGSFSNLQGADDERTGGAEACEGDKSFEDNWSWEWWKLFLKLGPLHPKASWAVTRGQITKTAPLVKNYREGNVKFHTADVCDSEVSVDGRRCVTLTDGTRIEGIHSVVNATGYKTVWPFLASEGLSEHCTKDRYRLVFHPELPNCAFVGFCRGGVGSIMQGIEMQARWAALVCSGTRRLPPVNDMKALMVEHQHQMIGKFATKITNIYCNALARYEVGCEPDMWRIFFSSPKAWFYLMCGPFCMSMFRFRGPHARPKLATEVFESGPQLVRPLEYGLQQSMELLLGTLCRFWTSVFFMHSVRLTAPMRQFVTPFVDLNY